MIRRMKGFYKLTTAEILEHTKIQEISSNRVFMRLPKT